MQYSENNSPIDMRNILGSLLVYLVILLPIVNVFAPLEASYNYALIVVGVLTMVFLFVILRQLSVVSSTPLAFALMLFGVFLIIYELYEPTLTFGVTLGGILSVVGLVMRLTAVEIIFSTLFMDVFRSIVSFFRHPIEIIISILQFVMIISLIIASSPDFAEYQPGLISIIVGIVAVLLLKFFIDENRIYAKVAGIVHIFGVFVSYQSLVLFVSQVILAFIANASRRTLENVYLGMVKFTHWFVGLLRNSTIVIFILGLVFIILPVFLPTYPDLVKIGLFILGWVLISYSLWNYLSPILGFLYYGVSWAIIAFVNNFNTNTLLKAISAILIIWDIFGFYLPWDAILRLWMIPYVSFTIFLLSFSSVRIGIRVNLERMMRQKTGILRVVSYFVFYGAGLVSPFHPYFIPMLITGAVIYILSSPMLFRGVLRFVNWAATNVLQLTGWIIASIMILFGLLIVVAPPEGNFLTQFAGDITGPARIAVGIGLMIAGVVFFREVYQRRSLEVAK